MTTLVGVILTAIGIGILLSKVMVFLVDAATHYDKFASGFGKYRGYISAFIVIAIYFSISLLLSNLK